MIGSALAPGSRSVSFERAALAALFRVDRGVLVSDLALCQALQPDAEARGVHHDEHGREALLRLADEPALGAVVVHDAGRVAVDSHLLLERSAAEAVALAEGAVLVHEELGHDEERNAFHIVGCAGDLGEDQMDDVFAEVVLARRDEDLGPGDRIAAVRLRIGAGLQQPKIGAAVRLGEVHRAGPAAGHHIGDVASA